MNPLPRTCRCSSCETPCALVSNRCITVISPVPDHPPSPQVSLLELRDALLMQCLRLPLTRDGAAAIMQGFSFEWVADKAAFRDAHGIVTYL